MAKGDLPNGARFRVFAERASVFFDREGQPGSFHIHRGSGRFLCLDEFFPQPQGTSCGPLQPDEVIQPRLWGYNCDPEHRRDGLSSATGTVTRRADRVVLTYYDGVKQPADIYPAPRSIHLRRSIFFAARRYGIDLHYVAAFDREGGLLGRFVATRKDERFGHSECLPPTTEWSRPYKRDFASIRRARARRDHMTSRTMLRIYDFADDGTDPQRSRLLGRDRYGDPLYALPTNNRGWCVLDANGAGSCGSLRQAYNGRSLTSELCPDHTDHEVRFHGLFPDGISEVSVTRRDGTSFPITPKGNLIVAFGERAEVDRQPETLNWTWRGKARSTSVPIPDDAADIDC